MILFAFDVTKSFFLNKYVNIIWLSLCMGSNVTSSTYNKIYNNCKPNNALIFYKKKILLISHFLYKSGSYPEFMYFQRFENTWILMFCRSEAAFQQNILIKYRTTHITFLFKVELISITNTQTQYAVLYYCDSVCCNKKKVVT